MKKKVLCGLWLLMIILVSCTIISFFIQRQMTARAETDKGISAEYEGRSCLLLPASAVRTDGLGTYVFEVEKGVRGDNSAYAKRRQLGVLGYQGDFIFTDLSYGAEFVTYLSKPIEDGDKLNVTSTNTLGKDIFLILLEKKGKTPVLSMSVDSLRVLGKSNSSLLLAGEKLSQPFLKEKVMTELFEYRESADIQIFSLSDVQALFEVFPYLAVVLLLLAFPTILWIPSVVSIIKRIKGKACFLLVNVVLSTLSYILLTYLLSMLSLPSSLLPEYNILEFRFYERQLSSILENALQFSQVEGIKTSLEGFQEKAEISVAIVLFGMFLLMLLLIFEFRILYSRSKIHDAVER